MKYKTLSRRSFLEKTALAAAGITIVPSHVVSGLGYKAPSDKLNIAGIGVGGKGFSNLRELESENIVALCDVDWDYAKRAFDQFPNAKKFKDWRRMYDEFGKNFDAIMVATADHTHAIITAHALTQGKHVYCEKPFTHSVYESRLLTKLAEKYKVATQMGNQGASGEGVSLITEWLTNNEIGEVTKVEAFTDRPLWPQGLNTPEQGHWVPDTLDWDLFTGPAKMRPYNQIYHPWNWRGWWDYGTGALGDMACHILHPVFAGLELEYPTHARGSSTLLLQDCAPNAQSVILTFPSRASKRNWRGMKKNGHLPQVEVYWYDGGIMPKLPEGWPEGKDPYDRGGGIIFHGTKDKLICGCYGLNPWLLSGRVPNAPEFCRRIETSHQMDWVRACKENPGNRINATSEFSEAGPFNEMVVMGVLAVRLQALNKTLAWNGEEMQFTNLTNDETVTAVKNNAIEMRSGRTRSVKTWTDPVPAKEFAAELIQHTYREPWKLPEMPA
ncbi:MAG: Gfo/Idh/MocA family oxidoreductase [Mariniphaga sp.]|jgi:predicted dehydrogenase|nr:Gfo/Idh/MocA family oxidoreductase [Mariniphaga sp.]